MSMETFYYIAAAVAVLWTVLLCTYPRPLKR